MRHPFATCCARPASAASRSSSSVGGAFILLLNPIFWALTTMFFFTQAGFIQDMFPGFVFYAAAFLLFVGNFVFVYLNVAGSIQRGYPELAKYALLLPALLGADVDRRAGRAAFQLFTNPFYWEKTEHGLATTADTHAPLRAGEPEQAPPPPLPGANELDESERAAAENGDVASAPGGGSVDDAGPTDGTPVDDTLAHAGGPAETMGSREGR